MYDDSPLVFEAEAPLTFELISLGSPSAHRKVFQSSIQLIQITLHCHDSHLEGVRPSETLSCPFSSTPPFEKLLTTP